MRVTVEVDYDIIGCNFPMREAIERALMNQMFTLDSQGQIIAAHYENIKVQKQYRDRIYDPYVDSVEFPLTFTEVRCYLIERHNQPYKYHRYRVNRLDLVGYLTRLETGPVTVKDVVITDQLVSSDKYPSHEVYFHEGVISYKPEPPGPDYQKVYMKVFHENTFESPKYFAFDAEGNF